MDQGCYLMHSTLSGLRQEFWQGGHFGQKSFCSMPDFKRWYLFHGGSNWLAGVRSFGGHNHL